MPYKCRAGTLLHVVCDAAVATGHYAQLQSDGLSRHILIPLVCLQHVSDFFVTSANAALSKSDEPEKVRSQARSCTFR